MADDARRVLDEAIGRRVFPAATVEVGTSAGAEWRHASGALTFDRDAAPAEISTPFDLASLTKPIATTTSILLLASDGALGIDDTVSKFLPDFAERDKQSVTIRHLLTHSSGLRPWRGFHDLLLDKERRTGERLIGTPAARERKRRHDLRPGFPRRPSRSPTAEPDRGPCSRTALSRSAR
jgi:CubicO group peptidase (beta-lactamase class C family)